MVIAVLHALIARRSFSTAAPLTWNSLPPAVLNCGSAFKSKHKTHLFLLLSANYSAYIPVPPAPLLPPNGIMALYKFRIIIIIIIIIINEFAAC